MSKFAILLILGVWLVGGCRIPPQNGESGPPAPQILPSGDVIGVEPAQTIVVDPAPAPPVTKPLWMMIPKSWHRDCKRWIKPIASATYKYGDPQDSPLMYAAQIRQESLCNPDAKSHVGAQGLLQLMPATAREIKEKWNEGIFDPWTAGDNIRAGLWYYNKRTRRFWNPDYRSFCDRAMLGFSGYNSGNGYWLRAQRKCETVTPGQCNGFFDMAEYLPQVNPNGAHENINYVRLISKSWHGMMGDQACPIYDATRFLQ